MPSFRFLKPCLTAVLLAAIPFQALAISPSLAGDLVKAQVILGKVTQIMDKYREMTVELEAPEPLEGVKGKFLLPYTAEGEPTEWAQKALSAEAGKLIGEKVGDKAVGALASKVPFGGLAGGLMKKKVKETAGVMALGGMDFIKETSDQSFNSLNDYAVYLHVRHGSEPSYKETLAAAVALYPDLEKTMPSAIQQAYKQQAKK